MNSKVASETSNSLKIGEMTSGQGPKLTSNDFSGLKKPQNWWNNLRDLKWHLKVSVASIGLKIGEIIFVTSNNLIDLN